MREGTRTTVHSQHSKATCHGEQGNQTPGYVVTKCHWCHIHRRSGRGRDTGSQERLPSIFVHSLLFLHGSLTRSWPGGKQHDNAAAAHTGLSTGQILASHWGRAGLS